MQATVYDLPIEILTTIFQIIVDDAHLKKDEITQFLRQCASMKAFVSVSRAHLFRTARITNVWESVLQAPHICPFVHNLSIDLSYIEDFQEPSSGFYAAAFSSFSNVVKLRILELRDWYRIPASLRTGLSRVMSMKNFRSLELKGCYFEKNLTDLQEILRFCRGKINELVFHDCGSLNWRGGGPTYAEDEIEGMVTNPVILPHLKTLRFLMVQQYIRTAAFMTCPQLKALEADLLYDVDDQPYVLPPFLPQSLESLTLVAETTIEWDTYLTPTDIQPSFLSFTVKPSYIPLGETFDWLAEFIDSLPHPKALRKVYIVITDLEELDDLGDEYFEGLSTLIRDLKRTGKLESFELCLKRKEEAKEAENGESDDDDDESGSESDYDELGEIKDGFAEAIEDGVLSVFMDPRNDAKD